MYKRKEQQLQANGVVRGCQGARGISHTSKSSESVGKAGLSDQARAERLSEMKERDDCWAEGAVPAVLTGAAVNSDKNLGDDLTNVGYNETSSVESQMGRKQSACIHRVT